VQVRNVNEIMGSDPARGASGHKKTLTVCISTLTSLR
jgi:hypothetical protein